ncbi:glutamate--cysteine ligase [Ideonella sp.]|uniref:glutamate--cysteine ligase n=1 Tax=Ideonella sp. TaxID=1929293 RepID=UPI0037BE308E
MTDLLKRLNALPAYRLQSLQRGVEKESLRSLPDGQLAMTPHPLALGSALTHPHITTDFCESQIEMVTGVHPSAEACSAELTALHQAVARALAGEGEERLWVSSMPCRLPELDTDIPLGQYGRSNIGMAKTVYRRGLGYRYGRRMQTISGIHYNWSLPGTSSDEYFALIRNFRRHSFLLLWLFGASPAVCSCFVKGQAHELQTLGPNTLHMPYGTSLRMGRLGYQSDAQSTLAVSYNGLEGYGASLQAAMTQPYPAYEAIGLQGPQGVYRQLSTTLLQIENEFYGTIRPKRPIRSGERPLHALRERGVEYVEVRCMDLDPFEDVGIATSTMRFLDVFLMHCLLADSPPDHPAEIAALGRNQHLTAARGREPGLMLEREGQPVLLTEWAAALLVACMPIAKALDDAQELADAPHQAAVAAAQASLSAPDTLPSARVLAAIIEQHGGEFMPFVAERSAQVQARLAELHWPADAAQHWSGLAAASLAEQARIESTEQLPFEAFRQHYLAPERLQPAC